MKQGLAFRWSLRHFLQVATCQFSHAFCHQPHVADSFRFPRWYGQFVLTSVDRYMRAPKPPFVRGHPTDAQHPTRVGQDVLRFRQPACEAMHHARELVVHGGVEHFEQLLEGLSHVNDHGEVALFGPIQLNVQRFLLDVQGGCVPMQIGKGTPTIGASRARSMAASSDSQPSCT